MSVEWSLEAWEEVQRHGQDLVERVAQGFTGLILSHLSSPSFSKPVHEKPKLFNIELPRRSFDARDFGFVFNKLGTDGVSTIFDVGNTLGQAGLELGACLNGIVEQFFGWLPVLLRQVDRAEVSLRTVQTSQLGDVHITKEEDLGSLVERFKDCGLTSDGAVVDESIDEGICGFQTDFLDKSQGSVNITSTYDNRTHDAESSLVAHGDMWRVEASHGSSTSGHENSSLVFVQLGPALFVRDSTLLLSVHLSNKHLLWYGYDRKNGLHSLCPAVWSKCQ